MEPLKERVLAGIYKEFEKWVDEDLACKKGALPAVPKML